MKRKTKVIAVLTSAVLLVMCATGVAFGANGAVPGDTLYGFDRAVESLGIGNGGLQERLAEATTLAENGDSEQALVHAAEALVRCGQVEAGASQADAALIAAANAVQTGNQGESEKTCARVAEMLRWMTTTQASGADLGQGVATRSREISAEANGESQGVGQNQNGGPSTTQTTARVQNQNGDSSKNRWWPRRPELRLRPDSD